MRQAAPRAPGTAGGPRAGDPRGPWQIERNLGPRSEAAFLRLVTTGELAVADLTVADYARCIELIEAYHDLGPGLVDASVVTVADKVGVVTLATLNRHDFAVVRPRPRRRLRARPLIWRG